MKGLARVFSFPSKALQEIEIHRTEAGPMVDPQRTLDVSMPQLVPGQGLDFSPEDLGVSPCKWRPENCQSFTCIVAQYHSN